MASDKKAEQSYQDWEKPLFDAWKEKGYVRPGSARTVQIPTPSLFLRRT